MDRSKEPGIVCDLIVLSREEFWRIPKIEPVAEEKVQFRYKVNLPDGANQAVCLLTLIYQKFVKGSDELQARAEIEYAGMFHVPEGQENLSLADFTKVNAAAILLPYLRTRLHDLTITAGLPAVILPPVNVQRLLNRAVLNDSQASE